MTQPGTARLLHELVGEGRATIPQLLAARAGRTPDAAFVLHRSRSWSYAEAWLESLRPLPVWRGFAATATVIGVGSETVVSLTTLSRDTTVEK